LISKREGISSAVSIINGLDIDLSGGKLITEGGDDLLGEEVEHQPEGDGDGQSGQGAPKIKIMFQISAKNAFQQQSRKVRDTLIFTIS
jgi:hypothetical protein